jgi:hypothetical protein
VPSSTDPRIEDLCASIRALCAGPYSLKAEEELRKLAKELQAAINEHVQLAKSSLNTKKTAINQRDPEEK